jgi:O-methyltransferase involved in polyketide biosynthesis
VVAGPGSYGKCQLSAFSGKINMSNEHKPQNLEAPSRAVQSTNLGTAYFRSFSDIPNAMAVAGMLGAREAYYKECKDLEYARASIPHFESRYKAIDALIKKSRVQQVVEFGAGHSTRGVNSPAQWNYVHTDQDLRSLDAMECIAKDLRLDRGNLHFVSFDVVNGAGMQEILGCLKAKPLAVVHEGLLGFYPHNIKARIAKRVCDLLDSYTGVYITTDIYSKRGSRKGTIGDTRAGSVQAKRIGSAQAKRMGRDLYSLMFATDQEFKVFFETLGFTVHVYQHRDLVDHLTSVDVLYPDKKQRKVIENKHLSKLIFEMTLK